MEVTKNSKNPNNTQTKSDINIKSMTFEYKESSIGKKPYINSDRNSKGMQRKHNRPNYFKRKANKTCLVKSYTISQSDNQDFSPSVSSSISKTNEFSSKSMPFERNLIQKPNNSLSVHCISSIPGVSPEKKSLLIKHKSNKNGINNPKSAYSDTNPKDNTSNDNFQGNKTNNKTDLEEAYKEVAQTLERERIAKGSSRQEIFSQKHNLINSKSENNCENSEREIKSSRIPKRKIARNSVYQKSSNSKNQKYEGCLKKLPLKSIASNEYSERKVSKEYANKKGSLTSRIVNNNSNLKQRFSSANDWKKTQIYSDSLSSLKDD